MSTDRVDALLVKLCSGDAAAAERVFLEYEPYLRMVVRRQLPRQLRAKFDSLDVVQSVWADLIHGFREAGWRFADAAHLRAFLIKATRHRFLDRLRQHQKWQDRERNLGGIEEMLPGREPRPSELVQAEELWEQLLALCPPAHWELLKLKREGLPLAEIAARTGLHESSVRRILYELAERLAAKQGDEGSSADAAC